MNEVFANRKGIGPSLELSLGSRIMRESGRWLRQSRGGKDFLHPSTRTTPLESWSDASALCLPSDLSDKSHSEDPEVF